MQTLFGQHIEHEHHPTSEPAVPPPSRWSRVRNGVLTGVAGLALFAAGLALAGDGGEAAPDPQPANDAAALAAVRPAGEVAVEPATVQPAAPRGADPANGLSDVSLVGEAVIPSVVTIQISGTVRSQEAVVGSGSGVVYSKEGHIITNAHVVDAGTGWEVVLSDGRIYPAELVGIDFTTDLAVLQIDAENLSPISIGSTDVLQAGDPAIAIGSPLGLAGGPSLSVGVVSAFDRLVQVDANTILYGMLQADAPITQGSSGGALVDGSGRLIGITSAVGVSEVGIEGIGFSSPVEIVVRVVGEIIRDGEATNPYLGITGTTAFGPTGDGGEQPIGVRVESVEDDSAAARAGIDGGVVVTAIEGEAIRTMQDLIAQLRRHAAGDSIRLSVNNSIDEAPVAVTLGDR